MSPKGAAGTMKGLEAKLKGINKDEESLAVTLYGFKAVLIIAKRVQYQEELRSLELCKIWKGWEESKKIYWLRRSCYMGLATK